MHQRPRPLIGALASVATLAVALIALAGCGNSGGSTATQAGEVSGAEAIGNDPTVVATVGSSSITRGGLDHWMATIVGGDYDENVGSPAPRGLVSDPPNYSRCRTAIESLGPAKGENSQQAAKKLASDCRVLYRELKQQALSYLLHGLWNIEEASEEGIVITESEFQKLKAERFASNKAFSTYLAQREWSLGDELYLVKRDLLDEKLAARHEQIVRKTVGGNSEALQRAVVELYAQNLNKWKAKTSCASGYVIPECKQYTGPQTSGAPDALLEQIAASR
jgi:hypothetical protein